MPLIAVLEPSLRSNPFAPWELRVGDHRVYYDIGEADLAEGDDPVVEILAIGHKRRNRVIIGEKEVEL